MDLLNIGCGPHFHPDWVNVDLVASDPRVIQHDLLRGLPFDDRSFDAVYHSHVLEHFRPSDAEALLRECFRVLRPRGVLRVAVPDLESIARHYLAALDAAERGGQAAAANLHWMKIELIDQLVRNRSGGAMLEFARSEQLCNRPFVEARIGTGLFAGPAARKRRRKSWSALLEPRQLHRRLGKARKAATIAAAWLVGGDAGYRAVKEGFFRQSGEVHLWMYDRVSLDHLLQRLGFANFAVQRADESRIERFAEFQLDECDGRVRKPDSLFVEAVRPADAANNAVRPPTINTHALRKTA